MIDWSRLEHGRRSKKIFDPQFQVPLPLLVARSKVKSVATQDQTDPFALGARLPSSLWDAKLTAPTEAHGTTKYSVGFAQDSWKRSAAEVRTRLAVHDELDSSAGYLPLTRLTIGDFALRATTSDVAFDEITFAEVRTLEPGDQLQPQWSWFIGAGFRRNDELDCKTCLSGQLRSGFGKSISLLGDSKVRQTSGLQLVAFALARGQIEVGNTGASGQRAGAGGEVGFLLDHRATSALLSFDHLAWFNTVASDSPWTERAVFDIRWHGLGPRYQLGAKFQWVEMGRPLVQSKSRDQFLLQFSYFPSL